MTKIKNIYKLIFLILSVIASSNSFAQEYFYITRNIFFEAPKPKITFEKDNRNVIWFDDLPSANSNSDLEIGIQLPNHFGLIFRKYEIIGNHIGEASQRVCFFGFCSFVSGSLISGNTTTDNIKYTIDSNIAMINYHFDINNSVSLKPRLGINLLNLNATFSGSGSDVNKSEKIPLPIIGVRSDIELATNLYFFTDLNYFNYKNQQIGLKIIDTYAGLSVVASKNIKFSGGYKKYYINSWKLDRDSYMAYKLEQKTPFLAITFSY